MQTTDDQSTPPSPHPTPTGADNPGGPMEINRNGITYDIRVDRSECDRRIGQLLAALAQPPPALARGAEARARREPVTANLPRPCFPAQVPIMQLSKMEYSETTKNRPPGDQTGGPKDNMCEPDYSRLYSSTKRTQ